MKQMFKYTLWIMFVLIFNMGCTLASRESFDLEYQESRLLETLKNGPFKSLQTSGTYNQNAHSVWNFDTERMEATTYDVAASVELPRTIYSFDVVEDAGTQAGIIRLYGSGPHNDKYVGVVGLTNAHGSFLKLNIQNELADAIQNASNRPFWEFVTDPTIFRAHMIYPNLTIVSLNSEGFWDETDYETYTPVTTAIDGIVKYFFDRKKYTTAPGARTTTAVDLAQIELKTTTLIPADIEIYELEAPVDGNDYMGIEYFNNTNISTGMKIVFGASYAEVKRLLTDPSTKFAYDLAGNAKIDNKAIRLLAPFQMVKLTKTGDELTTRAGVYTWDSTDELILDASKMTLNIISTLDPKGVTNFFTYNLKMIKINNITGGTFQLSGIGKHDGRFGVVNALKDPVTGIMSADFEIMEAGKTADDAFNRLETLVTTPDYYYQDKEKAILPYRLAKTMRTAGKIWVKLNETPLGDYLYSAANTEHYNFLTDGSGGKRHLKFTSFSGGTPATSFYKVEVVVDNNSTNGMFQLKGYIDENFITPDTTRPMHNRFMAVDLGTGIYKTQAKYALGFTLEEARTALTKVRLYNLLEEASLPSDHQVISALEKFSSWVAMTYKNGIALHPPGFVPVGGTAPSYISDNSIKLIFKTKPKLEVHVSQNITGEGAANTGTTIYELKVIDGYSPTNGTFELTKKSGTGGPDWNSKFMALGIGTGSTGTEAHIGVDATQTVAEDIRNAITAKNLYNYHDEESAPKDARVLKNIAGIEYMKSELESGIPNGTFIPWNTEYYTFTYTPTFTLTVNKIDATGDKTPQEYELLISTDDGDNAGIVKLNAPDGGPLHDSYMRIDVDGTKNNIRITTKDTIDDLVGMTTPSPFVTEDITHKNKNNVNMTTHAIDATKALGLRWAKVDAMDRMDDTKNGQEISFGDKVIGITNFNGGVVDSQELYTYSIMEDIAAAGGNPFSAVVRLIGSGPLKGKYLALKYQKPETPLPNDGGAAAVDGIAFAFGNNYGLATAGLETAIPYILWVDSFANVNHKAAFTSFGSSTATPPGYGTPSFVWLKNNAYNALDTETWTFNNSAKTVAIAHNGGTLVTYNAYMISADVAPVGTGGTRATAVFYLRKVDPALVYAPYHQNFVSVREHAMTGTAGTGELGATTSQFKVVINPNRVAAEAGDAIDVKKMLDIHAASDVALAFERAAQSKFWVKLDEGAYQLDNKNYELWEFKPDGTSAIKVTTVAGGGTPSAITYTFASKENTSTHRGVFTLSATGGDKYHGKEIAIGLGEGNTGTENPALPGGINYTAGKNDFDTKSMRLVSAADGALTAMHALSEWNFRVQDSAILKFTPIMTAAKIDDKKVGWVPINDITSKRWIFVPAKNGAGVEFLNTTDSTVYDILINNTSATEPNTTTDRFGIKMLSSTPTTASFQIFRKDGVNLTNTFVVLEVGTGANEKLMRVGTGTTLDRAQGSFEAATYNWSTYDRANADKGILEKAAIKGKWSLTRKTAGIYSSDSLGSAAGPDREMNVNKGFYGNAEFPTFDPENVLEYTFDVPNEIIRIQNYSGVPNESVPYKYKQIDSIGNNIGIYLLVDSFGDYNNKYLYLEFDTTSLGDNNAGRGKATVIDATVQDGDTKTRLEMLKDLHNQISDDKWNFFLSDSIKIDGSVFVDAATRHSPGDALPTTDVPLGAYVALGYEEEGNPNVYDPKLTKTYTIIPNQIGTGDAIVYDKKTIIISNQASDGDKSLVGNASLPRRDDTYTYEMVASTTDDGQQRAIAILRGGGPDANKYIYIRLGADGTADAAIKILGDKAAYDAFITSTEWTIATLTGTTDPTYDAVFRFRTEKSVLSTTGILDKLKITEPQVTVDVDGVYLDHETTEWNFADDGLTVIANDKKAGKTVTYKTIAVKALGEGADKGVLYLKGPRTGAKGDLHSRYIAVNYADAGSKFYTEATTLVEAEATLAAIDTKKINLFNKSTVDIEDEYLVAFGNSSAAAGMGFLHSSEPYYTYNPEVTEEIYLDAKQRLVLYVKKGTTKETNYYRIQLQADTTTDESARPYGDNKFTWKMIENTRRDLKFVHKGAEYAVIPTGEVGSGTSPLNKVERVDTTKGDLGGTANRNNWFWAFGIPNGDTGVYVGYTSDSLINAQANRKTGFDPKMVPLAILRNSHAVSESLDTQLKNIVATGIDDATDWYIPVNTDRTVNTDITHKNFAFRTPEGMTQSYPPRYPAITPIKDVNDFVVAKRLNGNFTAVDTTTKLTYLTKVINDGGAADGVILPHGITGNGDFNTVLSNQYVALRMGQGEFETRVKLFVADNQADAQNGLNALTSWNYATKASLDATPDVPKAMGVGTTPTTWVTRAANLPAIGYDSATTTNLIFDATGTGLSVDISIDGTSKAPGRYNIVMIQEDNTSTTAIFQLFGIGDWANYFIVLTKPGTGPTDYAKYGVASTITGARDMHNHTTAAERLVLRKQVDITESGKVFATLSARTATGPIVEATRNRLSFVDGVETDYYDPKSVYEYTFVQNGDFPQVTITTKVEVGDAKIETYDMEFNNSTGVNTESAGYFKLVKAGATENGKTIGFQDVTTTADVPFKIQVQGRSYIKLTAANDTEIGVANAQALQWDNVWALNNDKAMVEKPKTTLTKLSEEPIASFATGTGVNIQTPTGVYDPKNTMTYTFNADAQTLQVITLVAGTSRTVQNYNVSVVSDNATDNTMLYAKEAKAPLSTGTLHLKDKFLNITVTYDPTPTVSGDEKFIIANADTTTAAIDEALRLTGRKATYKYSYWTHERLRSFTDMDKRLIERLRDISTTEQTYYEVQDWDIAKNAVAKKATGLVMLADDRFYGNRFPTDKDGFFDTKDYYKFEIQTLKDNKVDYIEINHYKGTPTAALVGTLKARIRMLDDTSPTEGTFVILKGVKADGTEDTGTGTSELKTIFENSVLSININTDNQIMLGYSKGDGLLEGDTGEMKKAKNQLTTKMAGLSQYTPNMISEHIARQQHFVPYILSADPTRTFTDKYGLARPTAISTDNSGAGFNINSKQMTFRFTPGTKDVNLGPKGRSNIYRATVKLRTATIPELDVVNAGLEEVGTDETDFMIQPLQVDSKERMIFKFHKPTATGDNIAVSGSAFTTAGWKKLMLDDYQAVEIGTGGNVLQYKWVHGDSIADATTKLNKQAFFNGSHYWGATTERRKSLDTLTAWQTPTSAEIAAVNGPSSRPVPVWKKDYTLYHHRYNQPDSGSDSHSGKGGDQDFFKITEPNSSASITLTFRKVPNYEGEGAHYPPKGYNYTLQATQNGDPIGMYELTPKDMPSPNGGITQYALGVTGMGAMNGYVIFIGNKASISASSPDVANNIWKMMWVKPKDGDEFTKMVRQFLQADSATGNTWQYSTRTSNLKAN